MYMYSKYPETYIYLFYFFLIISKFHFVCHWVWRMVLNEEARRSDSCVQRFQSPNLKNKLSIIFEKFISRWFVITYAVYTTYDISLAAPKSRLTQSMGSTCRCKHNMHISRWRGRREFHWTPKRLIMAQCYLHPRLCRREYAENWPRFPFSFSHKVIFESGPRASGTLPEYIGTRIRLKWPEYPRLPRHHLRNYAHLYTRCTVYIAAGAHAAWELHVPVHGIRVTSSNDVPLEHQSRHAISRFLSVGTVNFYTVRRLKLSPAFSLSFSFSLDEQSVQDIAFVGHLSFMFAINPTKCFKAIGFRLQLLFNCSQYFFMKI